MYAKVSGLNTAADAETWTAGDLRPYVEHALEVFGADRLMFGSDWPVAVLAGDYAKVWRETGAVLSGLSDAGRAAVLGGTAALFYGIREAQA
nr:amidohydrolase family protein [Nonomuraea cypriaca]